jgi:uncharacterized cupredoxin-like copper-binding protein
VAARHLRIAAFVVALLLLTLLPVPKASAQVNLTVQLKDTLSFEPSAISVQPGENISLFLVNDGIVDHTFTLFAQPNAEVPVNDNEALQAYYGQADIVVDVLVGPGETGWANFTAPLTEGLYIFVCMIPGHALGGMHGVLTVGNPSGPGPGFTLEIGLVQGLMLIALVGTVIFGVAYHLRSTRSGGR